MESLHKSLAWLGYVVDAAEQRGQRVGSTTVAALLRFQVEHELTETGMLDAPTQQALGKELDAIERLEHFEVRGTAYRNDGSPYPSLLVEAFDLDLRSAQLLGTTRTNERGEYVLAYDRSRFRALELGGADLVVRAPREHSSHDRASVVDAASAHALVGPIFGAPSRAVVDLHENNAVHAGRSEWDRVGRALAPILGKAAPATLTASEIDFASHETNINAVELRCYVRGCRLSACAREHHRDLSAAACFALFLEKPGATDHELAVAPANTVAAIVRRAMPFVIPEDDEAWIARFVSELHGYALDLWKAQPGPDGPGFIARVATGDAALAGMFVEHLMGFSGNLPAFWAALAGDERLAQHVPALQRVTRLATLVRHHGPLVEALEAHYRDSQSQSIDELLPELPDRTWRELVARHGHPDDTTAGEYVGEILAVLQQVYSSRFVAARLSRLPVRHTEQVAGFLRSHARELDLLGAPLDKLLADRPELADTDPEVLQQVARLQRLYRAVGSVDELAIVMRSDEHSPAIGSAGDIARLGRMEVRRRFGHADTTRADRLYDRALATHRNAIAVWGKLRPELDRPIGRHVPPPHGDRPHERVPPMTVLAIDFCGCEKCRSVLGPAAYLADLLATVERIDAPTGRPRNYLYYRTTITEERTLRRADLGTILLDCANATTPLPYIDLVNELLEWHAAGKQDPFHYQTTRTPDELLVSPEHVLAEVYDITLLEAVYPWSLPFSLPHATARTFLQHFALDRPALMRVFAGPTFTTTQLDREVEYLALTAQSAALVFGATTTSRWAAWGLLATNNVVVDPFDDVNHPPHHLPPKTWIEVLRYGMHLRLQSGLAQEPLIATLTSRYLARAAGTPVIDWPITECSFDRATVKLSEAQAMAMHAFGRLARALAWSPQALDVVLDITATPIDERALICIAGITRLARRCSFPIVETLAWISPLAVWPDAPDGASLYERTFLSPTANPDHQLEFALAADRSDLATTQTPFPAELKAVVGSAIGLSLADLERVLHAETAVGVRFVDDRLDLATLSALFRIASIARAARLSIEHLIRLVALQETPPLAVQPDATQPLPAIPLIERADRIEAFLEIAELVRGSRFSIDEVVFVVTGEDTNHRPLAPASAAITARLAELYTELSKIAHDVGWPAAIPARFDTTALRSWLVVAATPTDADAILQLIEQTSDPSAWPALVTRVFTSLEPDELARPAAVAEALATLVGAGAEPDRAKRFGYVAERTLRGISLVRQRRAIAKKLAEVFGLSDSASTSLLARPDLPVITRQRFSAFELDSPALLGQPFGEATFGSWYAAFRLLHKQALLAAKWGLDGDELASVVALGDPATSTTADHWLDFDRIPLGATLAGAPQRFARWASVVRAIRLRDGVLGARRSLLAAVTTAARPTATLHEIAAALAEWRGVPVAALEGLATDLGVATELHRPATLERLFAAYAATTGLGVAPADMRIFAAPAIKLADAQRIRDAARASRPITQWIAIAKPLQDKLRGAQRDALVAYLGARWHASPRQLFDFFLIDVEMSDCQLTSRIQQAICSVQLFIQRVSMHLELATNLKPLKLEDDEREEWRAWVSTYRSWVEARSVFLYPESTLDPALRPYKSEPFVALEKKIDQADVTSELSRDLLLEYLENLDAVALLETRAVYREAGIIHVLARTRGAPHRYFYRRQQASRWLPWERVDLDITDEHVVLVVVDARLFVFWSEFNEKNGDLESIGNQIPGKDHAGAPTPNFEIRLAWSERKHDKWLPKRLTRETVATPVPGSDPLPTPAGYSLHPIPGSEARTLLGTDFIGADEDLWILVRGQRTRTVQVAQPTRWAWEPVRYITVYETDVLLGWFTFAGCNGQVRVRDVTVSPHGDGVVGPLPFAGDNSIDNDDWRQTTELQLKYKLVDLPVLDRTGPTRIAHSMAYTLDTDEFYRPPMVMTDERRAYMITRRDALPPLAAEWLDPNLSDPSLVLGIRPSATLWQNLVGGNTKPPFVFSTFFHPYTCALIRKLNEQRDPRRGVRAVLSAGSQELAAPADEPFTSVYGPEPTSVERPYPQERIEFALGGAFSAYNWELFFYIPIMVADRLRANLRFDEAIEWLQFVFDPTSLAAATSAQNAWQFKPLRERTETSIQQLLALLDYSGTDLDLLLARLLMQRELEEWRQDALDPHTVAQHRPGAWMRAVVMRYVDTLIAWGDSLFRRETIESLNEATMMYLAALDVMGDRPLDFPARAKIAAMTYDELALAPLDKFSNALVHIENWVPPLGAQPPPAVPVPAGMSFYFCIPRNDKLDRYWDTLADRLYKVRHCLDIEGRYRQLALFDGLLDRIDKSRGIGDALDGQGIIPTYRFQVLAQKAVELANDVQRLGGALLAALEKKDAETLALLRTSHERALLAAVRDVKTRQVSEAEAARDALRKNREAAETRFEYYSSRPFVNAEEASHVSLMRRALPLQDAAGSMDSLAGFLHLIPDFDVGISGFCGSPVSTFKFGGTQLGGAMSAVGAALRTQAGHLNSQAALAQTIGGYRRRADDWLLQRDLARIEMAQFDRQIAAAEIRVEVAHKELANQELQMRNAEEVNNFLVGKFTSEELYGWMVEQLGMLYFVAYEVAYDLAKRAERAFQFERGELDTSFLQPIYFDKLRKGLLAGERLAIDLRRMEVAFLEQNRRDFEITKHISLVAELPDAMIALLTLGWCEIELPESLFDRDHPGHYFRRIKSLALSLPCVGGAFASVNAKVTIQRSKVRVDPDPQPAYEEATAAPGDSRFRYRWTVVDSFVVSTGQNDAGLFEPNLRDDRFLPCEGAGTVARIRIDLPLDQPDIDPRRIADAVLHMRYTARDGGLALANVARKTLTEGQMFASARHDLPDAWQGFLVPAAGAIARTLAIDLRAERFPYWASLHGGPTITPAFTIVLTSPTTSPGFVATLRQPSGASVSITFAPSSTNAHVLAATGGAGAPGVWELEIASSDVASVEIDDIAIVAGFSK